MGQKNSKDELVYQQVLEGSIEGIKALRRDGASLEVCLSTFLFFPLNSLAKFNSGFNCVVNFLRVVG